MSVRMPRRARMMTLTIVVLAFAGGCANCPRDPAQAGFFCGTANLVDGTYQRDTAAMQGEADRLTAVVAALETENRRLETEMASLRGRERALRADLLRLNGQISTNANRLTLLQGRRDIDRGRLDTLQRQLQDLSEEQLRLTRDRSAAAGNQAEQRRIEQELRRLTAENETIRENISRL